jgi:hypothetical protein
MTPLVLIDLRARQVYRALPPNEYTTEEDSRTLDIELPAPVLVNKDME